MNRTVLVVEDEAIIADDLRQTVASLGYTWIGRAASGAEAIQKAHDLQPEIVLMDVRLRGPMSGVEAAERIVEERPTAVVFLSAFCPVSSLKVRHAFVSKPFSREQLQEGIELAASQTNGGNGESR